MCIRDRRDAAEPAGGVESCADNCGARRGATGNTGGGERAAIGMGSRECISSAGTGLHVNSGGPLPMVSMECSIQYATDGTSGNGGMDRGRLLAAMDAELVSALSAEPHTVPDVYKRQAEKL